MAAAAIGGALLVRSLAGADALPQPATLAELTDLARRRARPDAAAWSGLLRWGVVLPATVLALLIAVDGRHRDFWTLAFWLPAVFFALDSRKSRHRPAGIRAEEGWIAGLLLVAAPFCVDALVDREALAWAGCCVVLASPWLGATAAEIRRLAGALRPSRRLASNWR